ncbi:hypothetical protein ACIQU6_33770 [Streptomyces sp. NPDC090442]|uniref:hypothetical protein n=1 Tax=Streptomyces sp. NPDC090442 TaxID=3365962 RepID=UPI00381D9C4E
MGVASGASIPKPLVKQALQRLVQHGYDDEVDIEVVKVADEHQRSVLPQGLGIALVWKVEVRSTASRRSEAPVCLSTPGRIREESYCVQHE